MNLKVTGCDERGIFFSETGRIVIYLNNHETLDDILCTITHELIHKCINDFDETLDDDQEEAYSWWHVLATEHRQGQYMKQYNLEKDYILSLRDKV